MTNIENIKGVGPHEHPWPNDSDYDVDLLAEGDRRNVIDDYRYKTVESIKTDMKSKTYGLEIAIENYQHDFNIGTIIRNANAFNVRCVHIIGSKQWNKRGAMMTDKYLTIKYYKNTEEFLNNIEMPTIVIDNKTGSHNLNSSSLPTEAIYVFGSESDGVTDDLIRHSKTMIAIEQFGSTRSVNVGVASGILMYEWTRRNVIEMKQI